MEMLTRPCPLCGSADGGRIFAEADFDLSKLDSFAFASRKMPEYMHYRLMECPECDLLYASPLPRQEELAGGYSEAAYDSGVEAHHAAATYAAVLSPFIRHLPDRCGALDIGTGDGAFLEQLLRLGFRDVAGVEPSRAPIAAARDDIRPLIREGIFRGKDYTPGSFSLITCFQTIEHLHDPCGMVREVKDLLRPGGGALLVCHNRRALANRLLGRKSPIFDIEHLQLFSPASARHLLERNGFSGVRVMGIVNRYPLRYWLRLLPLPQRVKCWLIAMADRAGAGALAVSLPVGNMAVVGFKPAGQ